MGVAIEKIVVGEWSENVYLVYGHRDLVIIDPGDEAHRIIERIEALDRTPLAVLVTHGHFDHIGAVCPLMTRYQIPFYMHSKDNRLLRQANFYRKMANSRNFIEVPRPDKRLDGLKKLEFGEVSLGIFHLPGHTHGSVCFRAGNCLLSGDLIFEQDQGRTDLPESDPEALQNSIRYLLENFGDSFIYPGHGDNFKLKSIHRTFFS